jgi:CspA family cold shock protein
LFLIILAMELVMVEDDKTIYYGEVLWFDGRRGFGFLAWSNQDGIKQKDMFVHFSNLQIEGFKTLHKHQKVSFKLGVNNNGDPKAICVEVLAN